MMTSGKAAGWLCMFLALAGLSMRGEAQTKKTAFGQSDPQAKTILDAASKKFKSYSSVKAGFALKITTPDDKVLDTQHGTVLLKGNKYKAILGGQEIYCDGKTLWSYNKDTKEVQVNDYQPDNSTITPSRLFTQFYDEDFLYRLAGSAHVGGKSVDVIEMTPLDKSKPFFKVLLRVDKATHNVVSTEIFEKGGNRYSYEVTSFTPNAPVTDADFVFDSKAHPGVEVVDLR